MCVSVSTWVFKTYTSSDPLEVQHFCRTPLARMSKIGNNGNGNGPPVAAMKDGSSPPFGDAANPSWVPFGERVDYAKVLLLGVTYSGIIIAAHSLAYLIRFEFSPPTEQQALLWQNLLWSLPLELAFLFAFGQFRSLLSYFSLPDARRVVFACAATSLIATAIWYATGGSHAPPRSIIILSFLLDTAGLINVRILFRTLRARQKEKGKNGKMPRRVVIVGAGDVGANLVREMTLRRDLCMVPVAFFDDDRRKWNTYIHGVPVVGRPELLATGKIRADEAIIAMPSASGKRVREVVQAFNEAHLKFESVPSMEQIVTGAVKVSQIRPVEIEDLLGRETVCLETDRISGLVRDKVVMVTGAGGSIGCELCRQIAGYHPLRLILVERCEVQIFPIEQELLALGYGAQVIPLVADIFDDERMLAVFQRFRPQVVFHAAAHKHVPMMEHQPYEAFRNNTIGTKKLAKLSAQFAVERFVLISTDKAVNPTNVMGATKRLAELYIQALQKEIWGRRQETGVRSQETNDEAERRKSGKAEKREVGRQANLEIGKLGNRETEDENLKIVKSGNLETANGAAGKAGNLEIVRAKMGNGGTEKREIGNAGKRETADGGNGGRVGGKGENREIVKSGNLETRTNGCTEKRAIGIAELTVSPETKLKLTRFMAVRFGNVLGSSGSVIPTFKRQIAAGGPVTVTHPEVTRYFMTIPEAVGLVLQSATLGQGGEIFVLDMGKRVKIVELARQLIELSGLKPDIDIEIKFTGLRPGEKLFEEINHNTEDMEPTEHPKIMRFVGEPLPLETIRQGLLEIHGKAPTMDANQIKLEIQKLVPEYKPYLTTI
jgi:FlaA1/EpsC-like NDP-sugar epimerase